MIYDQFLIAQNWALGSAMAVVLILLIAAVVLFFGSIAIIGRHIIRYRRRVELAIAP